MKLFIIVLRYLRKRRKYQGGRKIKKTDIEMQPTDSYEEIPQHLPPTSKNMTQTGGKIVAQKTNKALPEYNVNIKNQCPMLSESDGDDDKYIAMDNVDNFFDDSVYEEITMTNDKNHGNERKVRLRDKRFMK